MTTIPKTIPLIESLLALNPSLAVFDCDGTLWSGDVGESFFDWELRRGVVAEEIVRWARERYADYRAGKVSEDEMCGDMVTLHRGLEETVITDLAHEFFDDNFLETIFADMRELILRLAETGCDIWAVSSTNEWVIRAAMEHFDISREHILAAAVEIEDGKATDRLVRVPTGPGKAKAILEEIGRLPDLAFGNSRWDVEMLALARFPVAVNPNRDLEQVARERTWKVYWPRQA